MMDISLNRKVENPIKQTLDKQKQTIIEVLKERETVKNKNESTKSPDFFEDNNAIRKKNKH